MGLYQITLLVTMQQEGAIIDLFTQRNWTYEKTASTIPPNSTGVVQPQSSSPVLLDHTPGTLPVNYIGQAGIGEARTGEAGIGEAGLCEAGILDAGITDRIGEAANTGQADLASAVAMDRITGLSYLEQLSHNGCSPESVLSEMFSSDKVNPADNVDVNLTYSIPSTHLLSATECKPCGAESLSSVHHVQPVLTDDGSLRMNVIPVASYSTILLDEYNVFHKESAEEMNNTCHNKIAYTCNYKTQLPNINFEPINSVPFQLENEKLGKDGNDVEFNVATTQFDARVEDMFNTTTIAPEHLYNEKEKTTDFTESPRTEYSNGQTKPNIPQPMLEVQMRSKPKQVKLNKKAKATVNKSVSKQTFLKADQKIKQNQRSNSVYCSDCEHTFVYRKNYENHLSDDKCRHVCEYCGKVFLYGFTSRYKMHLQYHMKDRPYKCTVCEKSYIEQRKLDEHMCKHRGIKAFMCDTCGATFTGYGNLYSHKNIHHPDVPRVFNCTKCPKIFKGKHGLSYHIRYYHENTIDLPFACEVCGKMFKTPDNLKRHGDVHRATKDFKCDVCNAIFIRVQGLHEHMKRHVKKYSLFCQLCNKGFYSPNRLQTHARTHSGAKPFSCSQCSYRCACRENLGKHMKVHSKCGTS